ncbi:hypothetical protein JCM16418_4311 [Paenibacillus pini JCM 16418]|uniref:Uncharacterized protein n=1 Tax=Paenibacillus pini JCM 16418 TaxID=1236976 RepID=W7Z756_9BACL|nr:hypothetical protein JCM16418_4311 [Paenibacillus pini JCM 16418]
MLAARVVHAAMTRAEAVLDAAVDVAKAQTRVVKHALVVAVAVAKADSAGATVAVADAVKVRAVAKADVEQAKAET